MRLAHEPTLIVIDNLDQPALMTAISLAVQTLDANTKWLLIGAATSLQKHLASFHLPPLEQPSAYDMAGALGETSGFKANDFTDSVELQRLMTLADGHPLTIEVMLDMLNWSPAALVLEKLKHGNGNTVQTLHKRVLLTALEFLSADAQRILHLMRLMPSSGVSDTHLLATSGLSTTRALIAIRQLLELSLLERWREAGQAIYRTHSLVHICLAQETADSVQVFPKLIASNFAYLNKQRHDLDYEAFVILLPHVVQAASVSMRFVAHWQSSAEFINDNYPMLANSLLWREWLQVHQDALAYAPDAATLTAYHLRSQQGWLRRISADYAGALSDHLAAQQLAKRLNKPKLVAREALNLSIVYRSQFETKQAIAHGNQALQTFKTLNVESRFLAPAYNTVGLALFRDTQFEAAISYYELAIQHFTRAENISGCVKSLNNLGNCYIELSRYAKASTAYGKAIELAQSELGSVYFSIGAR